MRTGPAPVRLDQGYSLPVVALLLATLSLGTLAMIGKSHSMLETSEARAMELRARLAADAGYDAFLARVASAGVVESAPPMTFEIGGTRVQLDHASEFAKVDLNIGSIALVRGLLTSLGIEDAQKIAGEIFAFRGTSNGGLFYSVEDLLLLPSVGRSEFERLSPFVTVYSAAPGIDVTSASAEVLAAIPGISEATARRISLSGGELTGITSAESAALSRHWAQSRPVFTVSATAKVGDDVEFVREATVDLTDRRNPVVLDWKRSFDNGIEFDPAGE